ncbi:hypothetical protein EJ03DRAFT_377826 [Teratosphaeria nubilosa]|uniref:Mitochondrial outer membrane protein n=1 Tax=Teratosphaeria nubilosa TaxID=161662 RepID=A0A6G1KXT1_9PEZI|nr:hypothetical protein EJ03DRAFT_377826 [Teratosphaeria nubilosa]
MSNDDKSDAQSAKPTRVQRPVTTWHGDLFRIPQPLKAVFDKFPLVTYGENELPARAPRARDEHILHVFTMEQGAKDGRPSFNPACLKWQAYFKFHDIPFCTFVSSNHASPSGALPFLLPGGSSSKDPVPSNKLKKWTASQQPGKQIADPDDLRFEAYASLIDSRIRVAWLFQLYLNPANASVLGRLYITPCSSNILVQQAIGHQLRAAAETELIKASASNTIIEDDILRDAEDAFDALGSLLGNDEWLFGQAKPGLADASLFAYTQLILDDGLGWQQNKLADLVRRHGNLVRHQQRIEQVYF